jgi:outer membrane protein OmpA-like peptidoglycan-associated protein
VIIFATLSTLAFGQQTTKIKGMIQSRSGSLMIVKPADADAVAVTLTDSTEVGQNTGVLNIRRKEMSMAALIPGLEVTVEAFTSDNNQLVAKLVKFDGSDFERARSVQAGLHETDALSQRNRGDIDKQAADLQRQTEILRQEQAKVAQNQAAIAQSQAQIAESQKQLQAQADRIEANKASIEAAVSRFGQLDDYYIFDEVTVLFGNGKTNVDASYKPQLLELAQKAKSVEGYMVQVVGYASSDGKAVLNQKLSEDRAANVSIILTQEGKIPLTNMLAPGAMGESEQIGDESTQQGRAENRRVVVRVLQNKGIAGLHPDK